MQVPFLSLYDVTKKYKSEIDDAVLRVVNSGWYLQGEENKKFEDNFVDITKNINMDIQEEDF